MQRSLDARASWKPAFSSGCRYYGPGALFFAQMLGIFGLPIPDEFLLTVAGALIREGHLPIGWTLLAAIAGAFSGISLSYVLGRTIGMAALHRVVHVSDASFGLAQRWFHRYGRWLLMFGYYIPACGTAPRWRPDPRHSSIASSRSSRIRAR